MSFLRLKTKCGAPLYVACYAGEPGVAIGVQIGVGSADDPPGKIGLAHVVEHLLINKTESFRSIKELAAYVEDVGGQIGAGTDKVGMYFWTIIPKRSFKKAIKVLHEITSRPVFSPRIMAVQRENVVKEIRKYRDNPSEKVSDLFSETVFSGTHPIGWPIVGTEKSVRSIELKDARAFYEKFFVPRNFAFVVAGGISARQAKKHIDDFFKERFPSRVRPRRRKLIMPRSFSAGVNVIERDKIENAYVLIGAPFTGADKRNGVISDVFSMMLDGVSDIETTEGRGWSFPMTENFDMKGLAYSFGAESVFHRNIGMFQISLEVDPSRIKEACELAKKIVEEKKSDSGLLKKAKKAATRYNNVLGTSIKEDIDIACDEIENFGRPISLERANARIKSVKVGEIEKFVDEFLNPRRLTIVVLKPK